MATRAGYKTHPTLHQRLPVDGAFRNAVRNELRSKGWMQAYPNYACMGVAPADRLAYQHLVPFYRRRATYRRSTTCLIPVLNNASASLMSSPVSRYLSLCGAAGLHLPRLSDSSPISSPVSCCGIRCRARTGNIARDFAASPAIHYG